MVEALKGGEVLARILVAHGTTVSGTLAQLLTCAASRHVPVEWVPRAVLDRAVAGFGSGRHQGVVALAGDFPYVDLLTILATALRRGEAPFRPGHSPSRPRLPETGLNLGLSGVYKPLVSCRLISIICLHANQSTDLR